MIGRRKLRFVNFGLRIILTFLKIRNGDPANTSQNWHVGSAKFAVRRAKIEPLVQEEEVSFYSGIKVQSPSQSIITVPAQVVYAVGPKPPFSKRVLHKVKIRDSIGSVDRSKYLYNFPSYFKFLVTCCSSTRGRKKFSCILSAVAGWFW